MSASLPANSGNSPSASAQQTNAPTVLLVEDNRRTAVALRSILRKAGVSVVSANDAAECELVVCSERPALILLDNSLPSATGFAVCDRLRNTYTGPIILLLEHTSTLDHYFALKVGATLCMAKPLVLSELIANVKLLLGLPDETHAPKEEALIAGDLILYPTRYEFHLLDRRGHVTPNELRILRLLIEHPNTILPRALIARHMWPEEEHVEHTRVSEMIRRIRRKLETDPLHPEYLRGTKKGDGGYVLCVPDQYGCAR